MVDLLQAVRKMRVAQTELLLHVHKGAVKLPENPKEREEVIKTLQEETQAFIDYVNKTVAEVDELIHPARDIDDFSNGETTFRDLKRQRDGLFIMYAEMNADLPWSSAFCYKTSKLDGKFILALVFSEQTSSEAELKMCQLLSVEDHWARCVGFATEVSEDWALQIYPQLPVLTALMPAYEALPLE